MIESLKIIEDFLLLQMEFYVTTFKQEMQYKEIIKRIRKLRKELEYEEGY